MHYLPCQCKLNHGTYLQKYYKKGGPNLVRMFFGVPGWAIRPSIVQKENRKR